MSKPIKTGIKVGILGGSHTEHKILQYVEQSNPQPRSVDEAMWLRERAAGLANSFNEGWKAYEQPVPVKHEAMAIAKLKPKTLRGRFVAWLSRILRAS